MPKDLVIKKSALTPTILVYNGISYLGLNLCRKLLEKGARVVVLDEVDLDVRKNVESLLSDPNFALFNVEADKGIPEKIQSVDYIFQIIFPDDPVDVGAKNLISDAFATKNLLDLAVSSKARFALVEPLFTVKKRGADQEKEQYSYAKNSEFLRSLVWDYVNNKDLNGRIIMLCPVYGPGMSLDFPQGLFRFIDAVLEGRELKIYGDGVEKSPYVYVDDAVDALIKALFYKRTSGRVFDIRSEEVHADLELAFIMKSLANEELSLKYVDETLPFEITYLTSGGEQVPRWVPETQLKDGLKVSLEGFSYRVNPHSFKPTKVIKDKLEERNRSTAIHSLLDAKKDLDKSDLKKESPAEKRLNSRDFSKKMKFRFKFPSFRLPRINLKRKKSSDRKEKDSLKNLQFPKRSSAPFSFRGNLKYIIFGIFVAAFFMVMAPAVTTIYSSYRAVKALEKVSFNLIHLRTDDSEEHSRTAFINFNRARDSFRQLNWAFKLTGLTETYGSIDSLFDSASYFSGSLYRTSRALDPFSSLWEVLKPTSENVFSEEDFALSTGELVNAKSTMNMALAHYEKVNEEKLPSMLATHSSNFGAAMNRANDLLDDAVLVSSSLSSVLGVDRTKQYLLLFQNPAEIRPTGGFIGSYGVLTVRDGKIQELFIDDIYNPDGQIDLRNIAVEPPDPISEFLGEEILHIRNANWSPDFIESASKIENLFFLLDNRSFDGIIGIDLNLIRSLLEVTGPVYLASYNEEISADNLYERTQYHSEFDYRDGISEKRSFLTVLSAKLLESVFALSSDKTGHFLTQIHSSLESRSLQIYVKNPSLASLLRSKGWDGSLVLVEGDFLMVVNSNLGGTKANHFVSNSYSYSVSSDTRDGLLRSKLNLNYRHRGNNNAWPGGPYTNYVRVYSPRGSYLAGASLYRGDQTEDIMSSTLVYEEGSYNVFAFSFVLDPSEVLRVELSYDLPEDLSLSKEDQRYSLYWQKQAGTLDDVFRFDFRGPFGTEIVSYSPSDFAKEKNIAVLEGLLNIDQEIFLEMK